MFPAVSHARDGEITRVIGGIAADHTVAASAILQMIQRTCAFACLAEAPRCEDNIQIEACHDIGIVVNVIMNLAGERSQIRWHITPQYPLHLTGQRLHQLDDQRLNEGLRRVDIAAYARNVKRLAHIGEVAPSAIQTRFKDANIAVQSGTGLSHRRRRHNDAVDQACRLLQ